MRKGLVVTGIVFIIIGALLILIPVVTTGIPSMICLLMTGYSCGMGNYWLDLMLYSTGCLLLIIGSILLLIGLAKSDEDAKSKYKILKE